MLVGRFLEPYIGQAVGGEWNMMDMIGGEGERAAIQLATSMSYQHHSLAKTGLIQ
jgi:hypothetical protein